MYAATGAKEGEQKEGRFQFLYYAMGLQAEFVQKNKNNNVGFKDLMWNNPRFETDDYYRIFLLNR